MQVEEKEEGGGGVVVVWGRGRENDED